MLVNAQIFQKQSLLYRILQKRRNQIVTLLRGVEMMRKRPIYIVGLPRSGTTWLATTIATARSVKYFHEPFNCSNVIGASRFCMKYLVDSDDDLEFVHHCRKAFAGQILNDSARDILSPFYRQYPKFPGRVVIKDVCSCLAVECIDSLCNPITVIVARHPCAVAASWYRLGYNVDRHLQIVREQTQLCDGILKPYRDVLHAAAGFWQRMGALWGAVYFVLCRQQERHPGWKIVNHEDFCIKPMETFQTLFRLLDLVWTTATDEIIRVSTKTNSTEPYLAQRISEQEPGKWRAILSDDQINQVLDFVKPFGFRTHFNTMDFRENRATN